MNHECVFTGFRSQGRDVRLCPTCLREEPSTPAAPVAVIEPAPPEEPADEPAVESEPEPEGDGVEEAPEVQEPEQHDERPRRRARR